MKKLAKRISCRRPLLNKQKFIIVLIISAVSSLSIVYFWNRNFIYRSSYFKMFITKSWISFTLESKYVFYNETSDINSPYFGLIYINTYGTSSEYEKIEPYDWFAEFTKNLPSWKSFMSQTTFSLQQYNRKNPNQYQSLFTSPKSSFIIMKQKQYLVGHEFVAQIQARDSLKRNKRFGGDYFRAALINNSTSRSEYRDGIPCSVQDHLNGTYTLRAPLLVPGIYVLEVLLCASVELISAYVEWTNGRIHRGYIHTAQLESNELVKCNSDLMLYDE